MTSYTAGATIAAVVAIIVDLVIFRTALVRTGTWWMAYAIIVVFQLITNGWLTGRGIVRYNGNAISGSGQIVFVGEGRIAYAPVEDLVFGFALVLISCAAWVWAGERTRGPR